MVEQQPKYKVSATRSTGELKMLEQQPKYSHQ